MQLSLLACPGFAFRKETLLDRRIVKFMERYSCAFYAGTLKGNLTTYFERRKIL